MELHDGITDIGERAFSRSGIEGKVVIPKKVTRKVLIRTFAGCPKLKNVEFHNGITDIGGEEAFSIYNIIHTKCPFTKIINTLLLYLFVCFVFSFHFCSI